MTSRSRVCKNVPTGHSSDKVPPSSRVPGCTRRPPSTVAGRGPSDTSPRALTCGVRSGVPVTEDAASALGPRWDGAGLGCPRGACAPSQELRGQHSLPSMARDTPHLDNEGPGSGPPELLAWPTDVAWTCQATCRKAESALGGRRRTPWSAVGAGVRTCCCPPHGAPHCPPLAGELQAPQSPGKSGTTSASETFGGSQAWSPSSERYWGSTGQQGHIPGRAVLTVQLEEEWKSG